MTDTSLDIRRHNLLFDIRRSVRYHNRRRAFFDRLDQGSNMLSVVFGSAAIYGVLEREYQAIALWAAGLVTMASGINLVVASGQKARDHSDFARQYIELEKKLSCSDECDEELLKSIQAERLAIEAEEPPVYQVLDVICHNEQMRAMGYPRSQWARVEWYQSICAQFFDVNPSSLEQGKTDASSTS